MRWSVLLALLTLSACSKATPTCGPANCGGCCDAQGVCQSSDSAHCGQAGAACVACAAASNLGCIQGVCVSTDGSTGSTGSTGTHGSTGGGTVGGTVGGGTVGGVGSNSSGSSAGSGSGGSTGGDLDAGEPDAGPADGGLPGSCGLDAGAPQGGSCQPECNHGFHCEGGRCVLNGNDGPIQVTLRWDQPVDLDLHVIEPGGCEVFYSNPQCVGSLDLDSNAGCNIDNVDTENVIYPPLDAGVAPPSGTYEVRVDYYADCVDAGIPYEVTVRHNGLVDTRCGVFTPGSADHGSAGAGVSVLTFTYP